jgi:hypothetical protein
MEASQNSQGDYMAKQNAQAAIVEAPTVAVVESQEVVNNSWAQGLPYAPMGMDGERATEYAPLMKDCRKPALSKVASIQAALKEARKEEQEERRYQNWLSRCLSDLDKLCVNPMIATLQAALTVAESDLASVQVLLQSKLADLQYVRVELAKLTGKALPKGKTVTGATSSRSRDNTDRFGLVGNESDWMAAVSQGPCTMTVALERCGQRWPQSKLAQRMIEAGHLAKVGNTYSLTGR